MAAEINLFQIVMLIEARKDYKALSARQKGAVLAVLKVSVDHELQREKSEQLKAKAFDRAKRLARG